LFHLQVVGKLAGAAAGTASWVTNVGNEIGQVLVSVVTCSEGAGLELMAQGLMRRYATAGETPPVALYVDRDCCSQASVQTVSRLFGEWPHLQVRLDVWHWMRRLASACTSEAHPLYPVFMGRLSTCIFEYDADDLNALCRAKAGVSDARLSKEHVLRSLTKRELQQHCRRRTRGIEETTRLVKLLIDTFLTDAGRDTMGVQLFDAARMKATWEQQRKHIACLQDPPAMQLYTQISTLFKGSVQLPVYRCARGSTSLESFHLHLARFIPGTYNYCTLSMSIGHC
jgi:hypothetical protein